MLHQLRCVGLTQLTVACRGGGRNEFLVLLRVISELHAISGLILMGDLCSGEACVFELTRLKLVADRIEGLCKAALR